MLAAADDGANGGKGGDSDAVVVALPAAHAAPIRPVDGAALLPESPPPVAWQRPRVSVETWRRRAAIAWRLLVSAAAVHTLGLCLVIPALWLPWSTSSFTREAYNGSSMTEVTVSLVVAALQMTMTCSSTDGTPVSGCYSTTLMSPAVVGGFFLVLAAVFVLCAGAVCAAAAVHLRALAVKGAMPPAPDGGDGEGGDAGDCGCYASVPAINGLAWTAVGCLVIGLGATASIAKLTAQYYYPGPAPSVTGVGVPLAAFAFVLALVGAILGTVAGCRLGALPGVGMGTCCCVANRPYTMVGLAPMQVASS